MDPSVPEDLISAYFDGEVTPVERGSVERLLESSTELRQLLDDTSKLSALLHSFPRDAAPTELMGNVQRQIESANLIHASAAASPSHSTMAGSTRRSLRREWTAFAAGMMATMASLGLYIGVNRSRTDSDHFSVAMTESSAASAMHVVNLQHDVSTKSDAKAEITGDAVATLERSDSAKPAVPFGHEFSPASPSGVSVASRAMNVSAEEVRQEKLNFGLPDEDSEIGNAIQILPQQKAEFLDSLKNGKAIVLQTVDPNNTVLVVELTVVDVDKGMEWMRWLFQKRVLGELERGVSLAAADRSAGVLSISAKDRQKPDLSEDLVVFYVRARGEDLADALNDSVSLHPEIYRNLTPQLPIDLPLDVVGSTQNAAGQAVDEDGATQKSTLPELVAASNEGSPVAVEANLVVNSFVSFHYKTPEDAQIGDEDTKSGAAVALQTRVAAAEKKQKLPESNQQRSIKEIEVRPVLNQHGLDNSTDKTDKTCAENNEKRWGEYAAFRVGTENQQPLTRQSPPMRQGIPLASQNLLQGNGLGSSVNFPGAVNTRQRSTRSNLDHRDPRLMRMLIVLKPEQVVPRP